MSDTFDHEADAILEGNRMEMDYSTSEPLQSPLRMSKEIGDIATAFCEAQSTFEAAAKASENPAYARGGRASKYADLASIIEAALPALNKAGIGVLQPARLTREGVVVVTRLQHKSGQFFESELTMPAVNRNGFTAQTVGSAITYARRYSFQSLICLAANDDDGNAASDVGSREAAQEVAARKIAEHNAKKVSPAETVPAVFWRYFEESHTAQIMGDSVLLEANKDLLEDYVTTIKGKRAIIVNDDQLESLKHEFKGRNVEFRRLQAA